MQWKNPLDKRCVHVNLIVMHFWCTSELNWMRIGCTPIMFTWHELVNGFETTWQAWVFTHNESASKTLCSTGKCTSTYQDDARIGGCSNVSSASTGCIFMSKWCSTMKPLQLFLCSAVPLFLATRKQASFFTNVNTRAEQDVAIQHVPSHAPQGDLWWV